MNENELDIKINSYLDRRLAYIIALTELDDSTYDDIILSQKENIINILESIYKFQEENKDGLLNENEQNILTFVNRPLIRFDGNGVNKENNNLVNKIIDNVNTSEFRDGNFLLSEFQKFFTFKNKLIVNDYYLENFYGLEQYVHIFLSDVLFLSDDDFFKEYLENGEGLWNDDVLYVLNYLLNDFPIVFKNKTFYERIYSILYFNKMLFRKKDFIVKQLKEEPNVTFLRCFKYTNEFINRNQDLMKIVDKKI